MAPDPRTVPDALASAAWPAGLPRPVSARRAPGGWVATTWLVELADGTRAAVKQTPFPADAEVDGLAALAAAGVPVPAVLGHAGCTLVMQRVGGPPGWAAVGRALAGMHQVAHDCFGWHRDNWAGRCVQPNAWCRDWPSFFVERRVRPHLADPQVPSELRLRLERACDGPLQQLLPAYPPAVLTHGDLWRGNVVDGRWVIDPEVSYADRELDLACMQMSVEHPLPVELWAGYREVLGIPDGYEERRVALGLHHRLLQVRHFGARCLADLDAALRVYGW